MSKNIFGLSNIGNTCYLNSAVQLLCLNSDFLRMENLQENTQNIIKIKKTLENLSSRFKGFQQQDSGEALILLLEHYGKKFGLLKDYEFEEKTRVRCKLMKCLNEEISFRQSNILFLDIIKNLSTLDELYRYSKNGVKLLDEWKCPKCNKKIASSKRTYYDKWSEYLIVGLKRFEIQHGFRKNNAPIEIPMEWRHNYKLKGAIIHSGSLHGGHYVSVGMKGNKWYLFNDASVSVLPNEMVLKNYLKNAYFLLYKKN